MKALILSTIITLYLFQTVVSRKHKLEVTNEFRRFIALSTFGFYKGGILEVRLENFKVTPENKNDLFGFSIDRTFNDAMSTYLDTHTDSCLFGSFKNDHLSSAIYFTMDLHNNKMRVNCSQEWKQPVHIFKSIKDSPFGDAKTNNLLLGENLKRMRRQITEAQSDACSGVLPITSTLKDGVTHYNTSVSIAK